MRFTHCELIQPYSFISLIGKKLAMLIRWFLFNFQRRGLGLETKNQKTLTIWVPEIKLTGRHKPPTNHSALGYTTISYYINMHVGEVVKQSDMYSQLTMTCQLVDNTIQLVVCLSEMLANQDRHSQTGMELIRIVTANWGWIAKKKEQTTSPQKMHPSAPSTPSFLPCIHFVQTTTKAIPIFPFSACPLCCQDRVNSWPGPSQQPQTAPTTTLSVWGSRCRCFWFHDESKTEKHVV